MASAANQLWSWDITWMRTPVRGMFFYLYLIVDLYSRKIVAWSLHEEECAQKAMARSWRTHRSDGMQEITHERQPGS